MIITSISSFIPGLGQVYLGFVTRGAMFLSVIPGVGHLYFGMQRQGIKLITSNKKDIIESQEKNV